MAHFAEAVGNHLASQIEAGADAVQLFDSWGGLLSSPDYRRWILPHMQAIVERVRKPGVPIILYVNGSSHLLEVLSDTGCDVLSIDWRTGLDMAARACGRQSAIQGNLDPVALLGPQEEVRRQAESIMTQADSAGKSHIFNLGHGILPRTPEENLCALVQTVHGKPPKKVVGDSAGVQPVTERASGE